MVSLSGIWMHDKLTHIFICTQHAYVNGFRLWQAGCHVTFISLSLFLTLWRMFLLSTCVVVQTKFEPSPYIFYRLIFTYISYKMYVWVNAPCSRRHCMLYKHPRKWLTSSVKDPEWCKNQIITTIPPPHSATHHVIILKKTFLHKWNHPIHTLIFYNAQNI